MFKLIKHRKNGDRQMVSHRGCAEFQECGTLLFFRVKDRKKPKYTILVDAHSMDQLVDEYLKYKKGEKLCIKK